MPRSSQFQGGGILAANVMQQSLRSQFVGAVLIALVCVGCTGSTPSTPNSPPTTPATAPATPQPQDRTIKWQGLDTPYQGTTKIGKDGKVTQQ